MFKWPILAFCILWQLSSWGYTVLLDPGHGGEDKGAVSNRHDEQRGKKRKTRVFYEKDLTLVYVKAIQQKLQEKRYAVHLTRSFDRSLSLDQRAEMADKVKADLFISVHMNASPDTKSQGIETYYLDNHNDVAVKKVEEVENVGLTGEQLIIRQIITDLIVERTVSSSRNLARNVHYYLREKVIGPYKMKDRDVRAGLFYVLALSKRPSLLLEVGFMTNDDELRKILDPRFLNAYAKSVANGIDDYFKVVHKKKDSH